MQATRHKQPNYFLVFALLAVATLVETVASYWQQPQYKVPVLIGLAVAKAVAVLLYFMHLRTDSRLFGYLFATGCVVAVPMIVVLTAGR